MTDAWSDDQEAEIISKIEGGSINDGMRLVDDIYKGKGLRGDIRKRYTTIRSFLEDHKDLHDRYRDHLVAGACILSMHVGDFEYTRSVRMHLQKKGFFNLMLDVHWFLKDAGQDDLAREYLNGAAQFGYIPAKLERARSALRKVPVIGTPIYLAYRFSQRIHAFTLVIHNAGDVRLPIKMRKEFEKHGIKGLWPLIKGLWPFRK